MGRSARNRCGGIPFACPSGCGSRRFFVTRSERYFIVRQFNGTASLNAISFTSIGGINDSMTAHPEYVELYNRPYYSEGDSWGDLFATADEAAGSTLAFLLRATAGWDSFLSRPMQRRLQAALLWETEVAGGITLYPNPSADGWIHWRTTMNAREGYQVRITDVAGRVETVPGECWTFRPEQHVLILYLEPITWS